MRYLSTIDFETGGPNVSAISWLLAKNKHTILFAVDNRSRIVKNIQSNQAKLSLMSWHLNLHTRLVVMRSIKEDKIEDIPLKLSLIQIDIKEVRDVMFYGSKISPCQSMIKRMILRPQKD